MRIIVLAALVLSLSGCGWIANYNRNQILLDERNQVQVNEIKIQQEQQTIQVTKMLALQKIEEAKGIAKSQAIINNSLTPYYLQYLAIQAQLEAAKNSDHTETFYIPSGNQGIPIVPLLSSPVKGAH